MTEVVQLTCRREDHVVGSPIFLEVPGVRFEHVKVACPEIEFASSSDRAYLASHSMRLKDGETSVGGDKPFRVLDLRNRLTFAPRGAPIRGWSQFDGDAQFYTAISFDPSLLFDGEMKGGHLNLSRPLLYFQNADLGQTLGKIERALTSRFTPDTIYLETLAMLAAQEISGLRIPRLTGKYTSGTKLTDSQARLLREYIEANVGRTITLAELANLIGLSRFHFTRIFTNTFGVPPYQYALRVRIEEAKRLLMNSQHRIRDVARLTGFSSPNQFSRLFYKHTSMKPSDVRRR